ncbi:ParA family protein [Halarsenatibacter silvermanii]|uniref:Sporulation initiation inhibitor protein Soj n=1 Tax=Halarsenatibacter silvermanii TaxID=321763 RepID=A0A1G9RW36_9FIRM|nr:ParA family protein [Halarsenatibacter silvermanii]SDM27441.1 chromosome partitioning protein [Halarsenatibacter silvermanii]
MKKKIAIVNQKGGVGKTTTAINLGAIIAETGENVLLADLDPQANMTTGVGFSAEKYLTIYEILTEDRKLTEAICENVIEEKGWGKLDLIPADIKMANAELELSGELGREMLLRKSYEAAEKNLMQNNYDYMVMDTNPSLGLLTVNAMMLADSVIIPLEPSQFSADGMDRLLEIIKEIKDNFNDNLDVEGLLICRVDGRTKMADKFYEDFKQEYGDFVFDTAIHVNVALSEAQHEGMPINLYKPNASGAKEYKKLAKAVMINE